MTIIGVSFAAILLLALAIHFAAKLAANRMAAFNGLSTREARFIAIVICPIISYVLFIAVLWLSMGFLLEIIPIAEASGPHAALVFLIFFLPFALAIYALVKWIRFQSRWLAIPALGTAIHGIVVVLALTATFFGIGLMLQEHRRAMVEYGIQTAEPAHDPTR